METQKTKQKTIEGDQSNRNAKIKGFQSNCDATIKGRQLNCDATIKGSQSNSNATIKQMMIKDMKITDDKKLTKEIAKFSKDRDWKDCTLTNFIKWIKKVKE